MLTRRADQKVNCDTLSTLILPCAKGLNRAVIDDIEQLISLVDAHGLRYLLPVFTKRTTICNRQIAHEKAMVEYYRRRKLNCCSVTRKNTRI